MKVMGEIVPLPLLEELAGRDGLNMTLLALNLSRYINGVAKKHGEVSMSMFPGYEINAITNGVHSYTVITSYSIHYTKLYEFAQPGRYLSKIFLKLSHVQVYE